VGLSRREIAETFVARLLVFPALLAAVLLRRRWRELLPVYALLVYATLLHAATHAEARLSDPFQPLLIVLVTGAAATLLGGRRRAARPAHSTVTLLARLRGWSTLHPRLTAM
jgi:hypothetical protein